MRNLKSFVHLLILVLIVGCNSDLSKRLDIVDMDQKWRNGSLIEAKAEVDLYLEQKPDNELAWTLLGHIQTDLDQDSLALLSYEKALELSPNTVEAITGKGIVFRKKGDYDKASYYYYQAINIDPEYAQAYSSLVVINLKRKKFKEAVDIGLKGYELDKEDAAIAANLSVSYHYINDSINREKYFEIAKDLGYNKVQTLRMIFDGELTIFD